MDFSGFRDCGEGRSREQRIGNREQAYSGWLGFRVDIQRAGRGRRDWGGCEIAAGGGPACGEIRSGPEGRELNAQVSGA